MKSTKNKSYWFYDEVYRNNILIIIGTQEFANKIAIKECNTELIFKATALGGMFDIDGYGYIVWLKDCKSIFANAIHEFSHIAVAVFTLAGIPINKETDEPFAYYIGFLTRKFLEAMK